MRVIPPSRPLYILFFPVLFAPRQTLRFIERVGTRARSYDKISRAVWRITYVTRKHRGRRNNSTLNNTEIFHISAPLNPTWFKIVNHRFELIENNEREKIKYIRCTRIRCTRSITGREMETSSKSNYVTLLSHDQSNRHKRNKEPREDPQFETTTRSHVPVVNRSS